MSDEIQVINQETLPLSEMTPTETEHDKGKEVSPDKAQEAKEEFSLDGYQVVRGESFVSSVHGFTANFFSLGLTRN